MPFPVCLYFCTRKFPLEISHNIRTIKKSQPLEMFIKCSPHDLRWTRHRGDCRPRARETPRAEVHQPGRDRDPGTPPLGGSKSHGKWYGKWWEMSKNIYEFMGFYGYRCFIIDMGEMFRVDFDPRSIGNRSMANIDGRAWQHASRHTLLREGLDHFSSLEWSSTSYNDLAARSLYMIGRGNHSNNELYNLFHLVPGDV